MKQRQLGPGGPSVSALGFGCMAYGKVDAREVKRAVAASLDAGVNFFDTADLYDTGQSEVLLGEALRALHRDDSVIPIPGTRREARARENAAAADLVLDSDAVAAIERIVSGGGVRGERYPRAMQEQLGR